MIYFISDTHFSHTNIIKYEDRPYKTSNEMDEDMIRIWNKKVKPKDDVYILGDFSFNATRGMSILKRLNGRKYLICGNHDRKLKRHKNLLREVVWVKDYYELKIGELFIVMSHYPMLSWNRSFHGSIQLFGHIHSLRKGKSLGFPNLLNNQYNVCWDVLKEPCSMEEIIKKNKGWRKEVCIGVHPSRADLEHIRNCKECANDLHSGINLEQFECINKIRSKT